MPTGPVELQPADVEKMLRSIPKFEGLRLDGDNVHRGQGNYKVSRLVGKERERRENKV